MNFQISCLKILHFVSTNIANLYASESLANFFGGVHKSSPQTHCSFDHFLLLGLMRHVEKSNKASIPP
jgi:hypothetical protein